MMENLSLSESDMDCDSSSDGDSSNYSLEWNDNAAPVSGYFQKTLPEQGLKDFQWLCDKIRQKDPSWLDLNVGDDAKIFLRGFYNYCVYDGDIVVLSAAYVSWVINLALCRKLHGPSNSGNNIPPPNSLVRPWYEPYTRFYFQTTRIIETEELGAGANPLDWKTMEVSQLESYTHLHIMKKCEEKIEQVLGRGPIGFLWNVDKLVYIMEMPELLHPYAFEYAFVYEAVHKKAMQHAKSFFMEKLLSTQIVDLKTVLHSFFKIIRGKDSPLENIIIEPERYQMLFYCLTEFLKKPESRLDGKFVLIREAMWRIKVANRQLWVYSWRRREELKEINPGSGD